MSEENVEIVRRSLVAFVETGEPFWAVTDEAVEVYDHDVPERETYVGYDGIRRWLEIWGEPWAEWSLTPQEFVDAGAAVIAFFRLKVRGHSGVEIERDDAIVYRLRDGLIVRMDYFNNRPEALAAAGLGG
jgi:ketosteroid isomerase-like protein